MPLLCCDVMCCAILFVLCGFAAPSIAPPSPLTSLPRQTLPLLQTSPLNSHVIDLGSSFGGGSGSTPSRRGSGVSGNERRGSGKDSMVQSALRIAQGELSRSTGAVRAVPCRAVSLQLYIYGNPIVANDAQILGARRCCCRFIQNYSTLAPFKHVLCSLPPFFLFFKFVFSFPIFSAFLNLVVKMLCCNLTLRDDSSL